ncbi:FtsX-like permease family protein [Silanimonas sp.]|uniref:ABC transporter permease n=1 Tax=Silanimonas sp. TaxID=1929290 RepID=UPI0022CBB466|nr:FtsX-like permease family protein [Silanimonas sp.]MCZ8116391.1 FtsX-like permease family protein [Silanimonas sp.]
MELRPILSAMLRSKTGVILIALQIALTLAILANALYVIDDRLREARRPSGLDEANTFHLAVIDRDAKLGDGVVDNDLRHLRALPGIEAAAWVSQVPLMQSGSNNGYQRKPDAAGDYVIATEYMVDAEVFKAWPLRLTEGRAFEADAMIEVDRSLANQPSPKRAVITQHLARTLWPEEASAIGKTFHRGSEGAPIEVIGVVETLVSPWGRGWNDGSNAVLFPVIERQRYNIYAVRTTPGQLDRVMKEAEATLLAQVPGRMVSYNEAMAKTRADRYGGEHTLVNGLRVVVALLLMMTASGIVGLASLWVNQRRKQIGVRRALGARRIDILRLFVTENVLITTAGIVVGCGLALGLNALMMDQLELSKLPLGYLGVGSVALLALGVMAVLGHALRAASVPPAVATRSA